VPHAHESGPAIRWALGILAFGSVAMALQGIPFMQNADPRNPATQTVMENFLSPVFETSRNIVRSTGVLFFKEEEGLPWEAWGTAWVIALIGGALAWFMYRRFFPSRENRPLGGPFALARSLAQKKFYFDEIYDFVIIRPIKGAAGLFYTVIDAGLIDTVAVGGTAWVTARVGSMLRYFQSGDAQSYAAVMAVALVVGIVMAMIKMWGVLP
jgi:NADH-quinone oxidoreductase subunit L